LASVDIVSNRVCQGDTTRFQNQSSVPATAFVEWDLNNDGFFDDATGDSVTKVFSVADTFEIRLRITDSSGIEYFSAPHFVIVDPNPVTDFSVKDTCFGLTTLFLNSSQIADKTLVNYADKTYKELLAANSKTAYKELYTLFQIRNGLLH
jgi:hypothetical protein